MTIRKYLQPISLWLRFIGLWCDKPNFFLTKHYWKYTTFAYFITCGSFLILYFASVLASLNNLVLFAERFHDFLELMVANFKAYTLVSKWALINSLMERLDDPAFQPKNQRQATKVRDFLRHYFVWYYTFLSIGILLLLSYILHPLIGVDYRTVLPMKVIYFYDYKKPILYELTYIYQIASWFFLSMASINVGGLFLIFMAYIGVECDIISDTVENLYEFSALIVEKKIQRSAPEFDGRVLEQMEVGLVDCIRHHEKILKFKEDAGQLYGLLIFFQFSSCLISLCLSMFQLNLLGPRSTAFYTVLSFQLAVFIELSFYCRFGNEVTLKSLNISDSIYKCSWIDCTEIFKKNMLYFLHRTQKPMRIFAINLFLLSNDTFKYILKTSWSAFALLRQLNVKNGN